MSLKLKRNKKKHLMLSVLYRLQRLLFFLNAKQKLKLFLDLAWIFDRMANEQTFKTDVEAPETLLKILSNKVQRIYIEVTDFENNRLNLFREALKMDLSYSDQDHIYEFDRFEFKNLMEKCGLEIFDIDYRMGCIKAWVKKRRGS